MQGAIRQQFDDLQEQYSLDTALDCSNLPDLTRQEFKDETDVNKVLARYGVNTPLRDPQYQDIDYDVDLQIALESIREARSAVKKLPTDLRKKYSTWQRLFDGVENGEFGADLALHYKAKAEAEKAEAKKALDKQGADSDSTGNSNREA